MTTSRFTSLERPALDESVLNHRLVDSGLYEGVRVEPTIESTNTTLKAELAAADTFPGRLVLTTDHQVAGRGRAERVWETPYGASIAVSVALRPTVPQALWGWLPLLAGLAVTRTLRRVCGLPAAVKWPNDVLIPDPALTDDTLGYSRQAPVLPLGKTCGILTEIVSTPSGPVVVIGMGINVLQERDELPVPTATSIRLAGGTATDRATVLTALLREIVTVQERWQKFDGDVEASGLAAEIREVCVTLGNVVSVSLPLRSGTGGLDTEVVTAVAEGIDQNGALTLRLPNGTVQHVTAGEVLRVRVSNAS